MSTDEEDVSTPIDLRDPAVARAWAEAADATRPWRPELRAAIAELLRSRLSDSLRVVELGPGPGLLAEVILATCTVESYTLLDFSPPFLAMCRDRLGPAPAARFVLGDFLRPDWTDLIRPPIDAVVTMQAVHELRHKRRAATLYAQIATLLRPAGMLVVCDHVPGDRPRAAALHATEAEQHAALGAAGFEQIETHVSRQAMYVISGRTPA